MTKIVTGEKNPVLFSLWIPVSPKAPKSFSSTGRHFSPDAHRWNHLTSFFFDFIEMTSVGISWRFTNSHNNFLYILIAPSKVIQLYFYQTCNLYGIEDILKKCLKTNLRKLPLSKYVWNTWKEKLRTNMGSKWKLCPKTIITRRGTRDHPVQLTYPYPWVKLSLRSVEGLVCSMGTI